jgi:hypothetical protein
MEYFPAALFFADVSSFSFLLEKLSHTKDLAGGSEVSLGEERKIAGRGRREGERERRERREREERGANKRRKG